VREGSERKSGKAENIYGGKERRQTGKEKDAKRKGKGKQREGDW